MTKRSLVWNYFTSLTKDLASCNTCCREVSTGSGSTSGLSNHLKVHHASEYNEFQRLQEAKLAESYTSEIMESTPNVEENYNAATGSLFEGTDPIPKREASAPEEDSTSTPKDIKHDGTSAPKDAKHDIYAELSEVSSLLSLAMPSANVNVLADEGLEDEAVAIEVRPKGRPFKSDGIPQAKWSVVILWLPSGTVCVYMLKMDRRIMECKKFQPSQALEVVEYVKSHAFINTRWEMCPGASHVVPRLTFWDGCDNGELVEYGTNCELLVPFEERNGMPAHCKFCRPMDSGIMMEEVKNSFKEEDASGDFFGSDEMYNAPPEVKVKLEEPEEYLEPALPDGSYEGEYMTEDNSGFFESPNSFNSAGSGTSQTRSKRSFVWDYFTCITKELATCNTCKRELPTKYGSSSGLVNHLRAHHKPMYHELMKRKQQLRQQQMGAPEPKIEDDLSPSEATQNLQNDIPTDRANIKVESHDTIAPRNSGDSRRSFIWDYFSNEKQSLGLVTCNKCNKDLSYSGPRTGTTSNLAKHLQIHHKPLYDELQVKKQSRLNENFLNSMKNPKTAVMKKQHKPISFKCEPCQMPFDGPHCRKRWARHMQTHKGEPGVYIPPPPGMNNPEI